MEETDTGRVGDSPDMAALTCVGSVLEGLGLRKSGHGLEAIDVVAGLFFS